MVSKVTEQRNLDCNRKFNHLHITRNQSVKWNNLKLLTNSLNKIHISQNQIFFSGFANDGPNQIIRTSVLVEDAAEIFRHATTTKNGKIPDPERRDGTLIIYPDGSKLNGSDLTDHVWSFAITTDKKIPEFIVVSRNGSDPFCRITDADPSPDVNEIIIRRPEKNLNPFMSKLKWNILYKIGQMELRSKLIKVRPLMTS